MGYPKHQDCGSTGQRALEELGYIELDLCRATFIKKAGNKVIAILCLHVDDGLFVTSPARMSAAQKEISSKFNIKEWQNMGDKPITFLGVSATKEGQCFKDNMAEYVEKIQPAEVKTGKADRLAGDQLSAYRRLIMQLRWPAHLTMPEFLYRASALAQKVATAVVRT